MNKWINWKQKWNNNITSYDTHQLNIQQTTRMDNNNNLTPLPKHEPTMNQYKYNRIYNKITKTDESETNITTNNTDMN